MVDSVDSHKDVIDKIPNCHPELVSGSIQYSVDKLNRKIQQKFQRNM